MQLLLQRLDRTCAPLNAGLAAVAIALAVLLVGVATVQAGNFAFSEGLGAPAQSFMPPF